MRRLFVAGNWKMHTTAKEGGELAAAVAKAAARAPDVDVAVCPPAPYLWIVKAALKGSRVALGAQNMYFESPGAFTGEVAGEMLVDVGCSHVILGHSERRHVLGETDDLINKKVKKALADGLVPIVCIGELIDQRRAGKTNDVLKAQLDGSLADLDAEGWGRLVLAYEPVWAIGTGETATPEIAQAAHEFIRGQVTERAAADVADAIRIQYGGSVKADNAECLLSQPDIDGALVGGASLKADEFAGIIEAAAKVAAR